MRRLYAATFLSLAVSALPAQVFGQDYPTRPIRLLVGYSPGGVPDITARLFASHLSPQLGQPITVENKSGAAGQVALQELMRGPADGYTVMLSDDSQYAVTPVIKPGIYDPLKDIAPVCIMAAGNTLLAVRADFPAKNFQELVAMAKAKPRTIRYASLGIASFHHLFVETLSNAVGMELVHVPYKGGAAQTQAVLSGDLEIATAALPTSAGFVKAGKLRYLVISLAERSRLAPNVPSMKDVGAPQINFISYMGIIAAGATPKNIIDRLNGACARAAQVPEYMAAASDTTGNDPVYRSASEFSEIIREFIAKYSKAVKLTGIKPE